VLVFCNGNVLLPKACAGRPKVHSSLEPDALLQVFIPAALPSVIGLDKPPGWERMLRDGPQGRAREGAGG
jgi:hypothetical protein